MILSQCSRSGQAREPLRWKQNRRGFVALACGFVGLNGGMLALGALQLAQEIDLDGVPTCPLCLLDLAWEIREGRTPSGALVKRTTDWVWMESGEAVKRVVVRARMQEVPFAEDALRDLELNGWHGRFAETVVWRLACELAHEMPT
jgi:hypothetical protein